MSYSCRFCRRPLLIALPTDPRMNQFVATLAKRACCNRCADYHRRRRDISDTLQKVAIIWAMERDDERKGACASSIRTLCGQLITVGEDHHLLKGVQQHLSEFVENIMANPDKAAWQADMFEKGLVAMKGDMT